MRLPHPYPHPNPNPNRNRNPNPNPNPNPNQVFNSHPSGAWSSPGASPYERFCVADEDEDEDEEGTPSKEGGSSADGAARSPRASRLYQAGGGEVSGHAAATVPAGFRRSTTRHAYHLVLSAEAS